MKLPTPRPRLFVHTVVLTLLLLMSWAPVSAQRSGASSGLPVLRWFGLAGTSTWAQTLDPAMVTDTISGGILTMTDAGLVTFRPNGSVVPDLATWKVSKNRRVYTLD